MQKYAGNLEIYNNKENTISPFQRTCLYVTVELNTT